MCFAQDAAEVGEMRILVRAVQMWMEIAPQNVLPFLPTWNRHGRSPLVFGGVQDFNFPACVAEIHGELAGLAANVERNVSQLLVIVGRWLIRCNQLPHRLTNDFPVIATP